VERPRYIAGDEVSITLELRHQVNYDDIELIFVNHERGGAEVRLGLFSSEEPHREYGDRVKSSDFLLSGVVPRESPPGVYRAVLIRAKTSGGRGQWLVGDELMGDLASAEIEVVGEDLGKTWVEGYDFSDD
jgi:hypothetical protein